MSEFIPTKASLIKAKLAKNYKEVEFVSYKSKKKQKLEESDDKDEKRVENEFNMKKAKIEVLNLGISGFDGAKKEQLKVQQLIKLGAKPPKNKNKNYKELIKEKKATKAKEARESKFQQLGKNSVGVSTAKGKSYDRKRKKRGILDIYGKIVKNKASEDAKSLKIKKK